MLYLISYHLQKLGKDYRSLMDVLTRMGAKRVLLSQWLLQTSRSASEIARLLGTHIDERDRLLVTEVGDQSVWSNVFLNDVTMRQIVGGYGRPGFETGPLAVPAPPSEAHARATSAAG
jgi:hypothetical protein